MDEWVCASRWRRGSSNGGDLRRVGVVEVVVVRVFALRWWKVFASR